MFNYKIRITRADLASIEWKKRPPKLSRFIAQKKQKKKKKRKIEKGKKEKGKSIDVSEIKRKERKKKILLIV